MTTPDGTITWDSRNFEIRDKDGNLRMRMGDVRDPPSPLPRYVKWRIATRAVEDVNTHSWPSVDNDHFIYYREPNVGDTVWYAYNCRSQRGRQVQPANVPNEVKLALVLSQ